GVPIFLFSNEGSGAMVEQHQKLPTRAEGYFEKPVAFEALVTQMRAHLPPHAQLDGASPSPDDGGVTSSEIVVFADEVPAAPPIPRPTRAPPLPSRAPPAPPRPSAGNDGVRTNAQRVGRDLAAAHEDVSALSALKARLAEREEAHARV